MKPSARCKKLFLSPLSWGALLIALASGGARSALAEISSGIKLKSFTTHSRLIFKVDQNVPVEWQNQAGGFTALFKGIGLVDLGAPLGDEDRWKTQFASLQDARLGQLRFVESNEGLRIEGKWKFPQGPKALAEPKMETFDFRERELGQFVVDFWLKKGPTLAEARALQKQKQQTVLLKKAEEDARKRTHRRLASAQSKFDANDVTRFCREPLAPGKDLFLQFLPFHDPVDFARWIPANIPDSHFPYYFPKSKSRETQYVRLAQNLYKQGKYGLVIKTIDFYENDFPHSRYQWEMRFLKANVLIKLDLHETAERILSQLMTEAKTEAAALHAGMYMAVKMFEKKAYLRSLESFLWLINTHPEHTMNWVFHLGAAESLYALKQTERALKEYQWVVENAPNAQARAEAAFRSGDLYQDRWQYEQALGAYSQAFRYFRNESGKFPSAFLNRAESLYQIGQNDRAKEAFEEFLKTFPSHPAGWRATYRLGEIHDRAANDRNPGAASRDWYYETVNRYPFTPGATLARLRLIECGDHGGFTLDSAKVFFETEAMNFDGKGAVSLVHYSEMRGLARVRSLISWGKERDAIEAVLVEMRNNNGTDFRKTMTGLYEVLFRRNIDRLLADGKKFEALKFYNDRSDLVRTEGNAADPDYLLRLSQAASDLGLGKMAEDIAVAYQKAAELNQRVAAAVAGQKQGDSRTPASEGAAGREPDLDQRLRESERQFSLAKAHWMASGAAQSERIIAALVNISDESPFAYEKEVMLGLLAQRQDKPQAALTAAVKAQLRIPAEASPEHHARLAAWLAGLEAKAGDPIVALEMYRNVEKRLAELKAAVAEAKSGSEHAPSLTPVDSGADSALNMGIPLLPEPHTVLIAQAAILEKLGRWGEAAATYARAVDQGIGGNQARFGYARALLNTGEGEDRKKAHGILETVASSKDDDLWKKMAGETLANERSREKLHAKEGEK